MSFASLHDPDPMLLRYSAPILPALYSSHGPWASVRQWVGPRQTGEASKSLDDSLGRVILPGLGFDYLGHQSPLHTHHGYNITHDAYIVKCDERGLRKRNSRSHVIMSKKPAETVDQRKERLAAQFVAIREKTRLSQADFAKLLGYKGASSLQRYASADTHSGKYLGGDLLERMLERLPGNYGITEEEVRALGGPATAAPSPATNVSFPPKYEAFPEGSVPVLGQTIMGPNGRFVLNGQEIDRVFMPPTLAGVDGAYAVRVYGTSMEPRLREGMTVWLHPREIARSGDDVVVQVRTNDGDGFESYLKEFVSKSSKVLRLKQLNPGPGETADIEIEADRVFSIHKVMFYAAF